MKAPHTVLSFQQSIALQQGIRGDVTDSELKVSMSRDYGLNK